MSGLGLCVLHLVADCTICTRVTANCRRLTADSRKAAIILLSLNQEERHAEAGKLSATYVVEARCYGVGFQ